MGNNEFVCSICGSHATETVVTGHSNNHGEADYQETQTTYYCRDCGECYRREVVRVTAEGVVEEVWQA